MEHKDLVEVITYMEVHDKAPSYAKSEDPDYGKSIGRQVVLHIWHPYSNP